MQAAPAFWNALREPLGAHGIAQLRALPAAPSLAGAATIDLLLFLTDAGQCALAVPAALQLPGTNPHHEQLRQGPLMDGWRVVALAPDHDLGALWQMYQLLFAGAADLAPVEGAPDVAPSADPRAVPVNRDMVPETEGAQRDRSGGEAVPFSRDLLQAAREGRLAGAIGREREVAALVEVLGSKIKGSACLVGDPGVGKSAIVEELARQMAAGNTPPHLDEVGLWQLSLEALLGGAGRHGEVEERLGQLVAALMPEAPGQHRPVLFVDEFHASALGRGDLPITELLKPHLSRGLRVIGATTHADWAKHIEPDRALVRRFQRVVVDPPDSEATVEIAEARLPELAEYHRVSVCLETVREVVELSDQWLWGRAQPDKALELLDASMAHQALEGGESRVLTDDAVCHALARMSGLGVEHLRQTRDPRASLAAVEAAFRRRIVGQPQAWGPLLAGLRSRMLRGLEDRPHLCLLLAGPSGVGKTETARQLAVAFGGSSEALVRLDGSEYSEPHCVARLIGSPPGYVGYGEGGLLTEAVKRRPRCVVLLDEVEKAASTVHNLLLQVMSAGRLTDGTGNSIDFRHSCLILTSNLGNRLTGAGGCPSEAAEQAQAIEAVRRGLPVELLGRLDAIVPFRRLSLPDLQRIVTLKLEELAAALPAIAELVADDATTAWLAQQAWSPNYGAREVDRVIRAEVEPLLSAWLWQDGVESAPRAVRLALTPDQAALALQPLAA